MDFRGRSNQAAPAAAQPSGQASSFRSAAGGNQFDNFTKQPVGKVFQLGSVILLFSVTALVVALTFLLVFGGNSQVRAVQKDKYQAVFLNNGQVYFGHINGISNKNFDLRNIYYLQTSGNGSSTTQTTAASNVSLVKLGCELHAPYDQMLINNDQIIFWENLQDTSQVVKAITDYKKQNTTQTCSTQSQNSTQQAPSTSAPTTTPTSSPTTSPTPSPTIKKP